MRAIVNMMSGDVAAKVGWGAREIRVDKSDATLEDVFRAVTLKDGGQTLYDLVREGQEPDSGYILFLEGEAQRGGWDWQRLITDSEQIFVLDCPARDS